MQSYIDSLLLYGGFPDHFFQSVAQHPIVINQRTDAGNENPDKKSPIKEYVKQMPCKWYLEEESGINGHRNSHHELDCNRIQKYITIGYCDFLFQMAVEKYSCTNSLNGDSQYTKAKAHQKDIALILADSERLQEKKKQKDTASQR